MKTIRELTDLVEPHRKDIIKQLQALENRDNQLGNLYQDLLITRTNDAERLKQKIFPNKEHGGKYLNHLKHRLTNRLLDFLLLIDLGKTKVQRGHNHCYKRYAIAKTLMALGFKNIGVKLAEKTLSQAAKFEFIEVCFSLANELMIYYGAIIGDRKLFHKYRKLATKYLEVLHAEHLAYKYYTEVFFYFSNSRHTKKEIAHKSIQFAEELENLRKSVNTYRFNLVYFNILASRHQFLNNYKELIVVCEKAIEYFKSLNRPLPYPVYFSFYIKKVSSSINLQQFSNAQEALENCAELTPSGSYNWHVMQIYRALLGFHSKNYEITFDAFESAKSYFDNVPDNIVQQWRIIEAYIYFFKKQLALEQKSRFKLGKFLNDVPIYSKDKRGNNISILILQVLIFLSQGKKPAIIDRIDALKQYTRRHLNTDNTFRSSCFIKMLIQLESGHFNRIAVSRRVEPYLQQLESVPIDVAQQPGELEVVPYEVLWEMVLAMLD